MYTLLIQDLVVHATHGMLPEEKISPQQFLINITLECVFPEALAEEDVFDDAYCYGLIRTQVISLCKDRSYNTIEALALTINKTILNRGSHILSLTTSIEKTKLLKDCRVGIRLTSKR